MKLQSGLTFKDERYSNCGPKYYKKTSDMLDNLTQQNLYPIVDFKQHISAKKNFVSQPQCQFILTLGCETFSGMKIFE